jgi:hypothetical protein
MSATCAPRSKETNQIRRRDVTAVFRLAQYPAKNETTLGQRVVSIR